MKIFRLTNLLAILLLFSLGACEQQEGQETPTTGTFMSPQGEMSPTPGTQEPSITISPIPPTSTPPPTGGTSPTPPSGGTTPSSPPSTDPSLRVTDPRFPEATPLPTTYVTPDTPAPRVSVVPLILNYDIPVPLERIYVHTRQVNPLADPLAGIQISVGDQVAWAQFKKTAAENSLTVYFQVTVPTRDIPTYPGSPTLSHVRTRVRILDWFQFNLLACDQNNVCQPAVNNVPRPELAPLPLACRNTSGICQIAYRTTIPGDQLPGGAVEANQSYVIEIVGTPLAYEQTPPPTFLKDCGPNLPPCSTTYPICSETRVCTAIKSGHYFRAPTPPALLATAHP